MVQYMGRKAWFGGSNWSARCGTVVIFAKLYNLFTYVELGLDIIVMDE